MLRSGVSRFVISHEKRNFDNDLNTTLCDDGNLPIIKITHEPLNIGSKKSLSEPFREYLLSRSVLTATPVDLSILNKSDSDEKISESLMYCLDGNVPSELMSSISNLAVDSNIPEDLRSPLKSLNNVNIDLSPNRKRLSSSSSCSKDNKKIMFDKENLNENQFELRETDL